jgi:hypothetical protein
MGLISRVYHPIKERYHKSQVIEADILKADILGEVLPMSRDEGYVTHDDLIAAIEGWLRASSADQEISQKMRDRYKLDLNVSNADDLDFLSWVDSHDL